MTWQMNWVPNGGLLCRCYTHLVGVIRCRALVARGTHWETWKIYGEVTPAFRALATTPDSIDYWIQLLGRFVLLLYDRTSSHAGINQAMKQLFTQKGKTFDNLPPTKGSACTAH